MPDIVVCPFSRAQERIKSGWATHALSLVDPGTPVDTRAADHLVLEFEDITHHDQAVAPGMQDVVQIIAFARRLPEDARLVIHCHAGIGRSPAAAIGLLAALGYSAQEAVETAARLRPAMFPNRLLVSQFDAALGMNGSLDKAVGSWIDASLGKGLVISAEG